MKKTICPVCGTEITVSEGTESCFCTECGRKLFFDEPAKTEETAAEPIPGEETEETEQAAAEEISKEIPAEEPAETADAGADEAGEPAAEEPIEKPAAKEISKEIPAEAEKKPERKRFAFLRKDETKKAPKAEPVKEAEPAEASFTAGNVKAAEESSKEIPAEPEKEPVPPLSTEAEAADKAFVSGQYEQAHSFYSMAEQTYAVQFRTALTSVYRARGAAIPVAEFRSGVSSAASTAQKAGDELFSAQKDAEINAMLAFMAKNGVSFQEKTASKEECVSQANGHAVMTNLFSASVPLLSSDTAKEEALRNGVSFLDRALALKTAYPAGTKTDEKGNTQTVYEKYHAGKKHTDALKDARERMAEQYNALPSRVNREHEIKSRIKTLKKGRTHLLMDIYAAEDKLHDERSDFYKENPEAKKGRLRVILENAGIALAIIAGFVVLILIAKSHEIRWLVPVLIILAAAYACLAAVLIKKSVEEYETGVFTARLNENARALRESKAALKQRKKELSSAEKELKAFNSLKL